MKRLRGMRQGVPMHSMQRSWSRMRWIVGLFIVVGCCFFIKEQRASATKTIHEQTISHNLEQSDSTQSTVGKEEKNGYSNSSSIGTLTTEKSATDKSVTGKSAAEKSATSKSAVKPSAHRGAKAHDTSSSTAVSNNTPSTDKLLTHVSLTQVASTGVPPTGVPPVGVPSTFGKSHFIVGMSAEETARRCSLVPVAHTDEEAVNAYDMVCLGVFPQVLFSPHDDVRKTLIYLIEHEKKSIKIAAYTVTEPKVAQALVAALKRGVSVSLIVDRSCLDMTSQKIKLLRKAGVEIAVFDGKTREDGALMHNKFFLFEENIKGKQLVWTGSANTTRSGYERNHENVIIVEGPMLFARYTKEFELLGTITDRLKS